jgi:hypothetical protein
MPRPERLTACPANQRVQRLRLIERLRSESPGWPTSAATVPHAEAGQRAAVLAVEHALSASATS